MDQVLRNSTLVDGLESLIIKHIIEKQLKTGEEFPSELELAEKYNVGRNVVREALSRLRMLGLIESRKRRGIVLSQPNVMSSFQKVVNPHILSKETILNLLGMRVSLEIGCANLIVNNITDEDIEDLKRIVAKEENISHVKVTVEMEREFHTKLYSIAKNKVMSDFLNIILPVFKYVNENFEDFDRFNKIRHEERRFVRHKDLIPYLAARDLEGYRKAVEDHLIAYVEYIKAAKHQSNPLTL